MFLYKKKDIIVIQKKVGINSNANQMATHQSNKAKILADSYELLLELVKDIILIQKKFDIDGNPVLAINIHGLVNHRPKI